ncbi:MAG: LamG domain-containing protein [Candidatus Poribacteria bacterium]|nr:LamG domain-containing protein [Candidatus Poribacteria bacterium]
MFARIETRFLIACMSFVAFNWIVATSGHTEIDPDTIIGLWLLDEGKGKETKDSSGNELHGTFTGTPKWRDGKFGMGLEFPGGGDTVKIEGFAQDFPAEEVTITSWVRLEGFKNQDLFSMEPLEPSRVTVHFPWDNHVHWQFSNTGIAPIAIGDEIKGKWQHWAFIHSVADNEMIAYQDGEEARRTPVSKAYVPRAGSFHIGGRLGSSFEGFVDEVGLFEAVLSQDDIKRIMDNGLQGGVFAVLPTSKLAVSWGKMKMLRE